MRIRILLPVMLTLSALFFGYFVEERHYVNSIGMTFRLIPAGNFMMGEGKTLDAKKFGASAYLTNGDHDEHPEHMVRITQPFYISQDQITVEQYREFDPEFEGVKQYYPYATGISWNEAVAFCAWLSKKEGKPYRLPTEAEWEYACRAGTESAFYSGQNLSDSIKPNNWGLFNLADSVAEWVHDWYGMYPDTVLTDPVGPAKGMAKVARGAGLDKQVPYYSRSANRAGYPPNFPPMPLKKLHSLGKDSSFVGKNILKKNESGYESFWKNDVGNEGNHNIGFRVVQAPMPETKPYHAQICFAQQGVIQNTSLGKIGPVGNEPYFKIREIIPTPPGPETALSKDLRVIATAGFHPGILKHNHSPALVACPNGDMLAVYFTSVGETSPDVALIAMRLRNGADSWDMPDMFLDFPDVNDAGPLLWNDNDTLRLFWASVKLEPGFPFQWMNSGDNGQTWSNIHFPIFETTMGGYSAQPINSAFRDKKGYIYIASDGIGSSSVMWMSKNNGRTWIDPGGRTDGRHTSFVPLDDGRILGMGGKNSDINGYMPESFSDDDGKSWKFVQSSLPPLGVNQRPTVIKLQNGKLFMAADLQRTDGYQPKGYHQRGAYAALSSDNGKTWHIKKIPGVRPHVEVAKASKMQGGTLGYAVARQAPNGIIHVITSMNAPGVSFAFNEAWILAPENQIDEPSLSKNIASEIINVRKYTEKYSNGWMKAIWHGGTGNNGEYLLHGNEKWLYPNGNKQWEATFDRGKKVGDEVYWDENGYRIWSLNHKNDGISVWTHWYKNGRKKSESTWKNKVCIGITTAWDKAGNVTSQYKMSDDGLVQETIK